MDYLDAQFLANGNGDLNGDGFLFIAVTAKNTVPAFTVGQTRSSAASSAAKAPRTWSSPTWIPTAASSSSATA